MCDISVAVNLSVDRVSKEVNASVLKTPEEKICTLSGSRGMTRELSLLLFAYDIALVGDMIEILQKMVSEFGRVCERRKVKSKHQ